MLHMFCKDKASITVAMVTTFSRFHMYNVMLRHLLNSSFISLIEVTCEFSEVQTYISLNFKEPP
jgi:hypothetical protein